MAQVFPKSANTWSKVSIVVGGGLAGIVVMAVTLINRAPAISLIDVARNQTVPFSHKHHVAGLGIDCRYCHTSVEEAGFAGIPPTKTCMSCHSQVWTEAPMLEPVRESYRSNTSLEWIRVHDLPDFVYFNHSIHVKKGVGCSTCHGQVDEMPLMRKVETFNMEWCLSCHKDPTPFLRPRDKVFDMSWRPSHDAQETQRLAREYHVQSKTNCATCHR